MKAVLQRVSKAKVTVNDVVVGQVEKGVCILLGINKDDTLNLIPKLADKIMGFKLWPLDNLAWKLSLKDTNFQLLIVSQFTLYAKVSKGTKPDFHNAMRSEDSIAIFNAFVDYLRKNYPNKIETGSFGQYMQVDITNDGPVTFEFESP